MEKVIITFFPQWKYNATGYLHLCCWYTLVWATFSSFFLSSSFFFFLFFVFTLNNCLPPINWTVNNTGVGVGGGGIYTYFRQRKRNSFQTFNKMYSKVKTPHVLGFFKKSLSTLAIVSVCSVLPMEISATTSIDTAYCEKVQVISVCMAFWTHLFLCDLRSLFLSVMLMMWWWCSLWCSCSL